MMPVGTSLQLLALFYTLFNSFEGSEHVWRSPTDQTSIFPCSVSAEKSRSLLARMYSDLQVPNSRTVVVVGENQCSDLLSQVSLPTLKARQRPPLNPIELKSGRFLRKSRMLLAKKEKEDRAQVPVQGAACFSLRHRRFFYGAVWGQKY